MLEDVHQAGPVEELVEVAGGGFEEEGAPDEYGDEAGDDHGDDEEGAVEELHFFGGAAVDADGDEEGWNHLDDVPEAEDEGEFEGVPELKVLD